MSFIASGIWGGWGVCWRRWRLGGVRWVRRGWWRGGVGWGIRGFWWGILICCFILRLSCWLFFKKSEWEKERERLEDVCVCDCGTCSEMSAYDVLKWNAVRVSAVSYSIYIGVIGSSKRREKQGTGIGLSIGQKIMTGMDGKVRIESDKPGEGCTFWLEFPKVNTKG